MEVAAQLKYVTGFIIIKRACSLLIDVRVIDTPLYELLGKSECGGDRSSGDWTGMHFNFVV